MKTLYRDGIDKVLRGVTTLEEVFRVAKRTEQTRREIGWLTRSTADGRFSREQRWRLRTALNRDVSAGVAIVERATA